MLHTHTPCIKEMILRSTYKVSLCLEISLLKAKTKMRAAKYIPGIDYKNVYTHIINTVHHLCIEKQYCVIFCLANN